MQITIFRSQFFCLKGKIYALIFQFNLASSETYTSYFSYFADARFFFDETLL